MVKKTDAGSGMADKIVTFENYDQTPEIDTPQMVIQRPVLETARRVIEHCIIQTSTGEERARPHDYIIIQDGRLELVRFERFRRQYEILKSFERELAGVTPLPRGVEDGKEQYGGTA